MQTTTFDNTHHPIPTHIRRQRWVLLMGAKAMIYTDTSAAHRARERMPSADHAPCVRPLPGEGNVVAITERCGDLRAQAYPTRTAAQESAQLAAQLADVMIVWEDEDDGGDSGAMRVRILEGESVAVA